MLVCVPYYSYRSTYLLNIKSLLLIVSEFTLDKKWAISERFWPFEGDGLI